jgi:hypothetical protein
MSEGRLIVRPFAPGSAPTAGRMKGSRNLITKAFLKAFGDDFKEHGAETIRILRVEDPAAYVRIAASFAQADQTHDGGALVKISINRFFAEDKPVTIDGQSAV